MKRMLFQETDFTSMPNPPEGFKYVGFDGQNFTAKDETGTVKTIGSSDLFYIAVNFIDLEDFLYIAPESFKIVDVDLNFFEVPSDITVTILVNNVSYNIGDDINEFDEVKVTISQTGFIKLNCEKI